MKIAVLAGGGRSSAGCRLPGARVHDALRSLDHEVVVLDPGADLVMRLKRERPEVAFIALGLGGEDGTVQELLEIVGIPSPAPA